MKIYYNTNIKSAMKNIKYIHGNAESTSFASETFDLVICNFLFHEVPPNATQTIIQEMYRLLKYGGVLAIVDLDPEIKVHFMVHLFA